MADGSLLDRWDEVDRIVTAALDLPPEERQRFVEERCGDDAELRSLVNGILERGDASGAFLDETRRSLIDAYSEGAIPLIVDESEETPPEEQIGRWRLVRRIGRGGMGTVYLAERADGQFEQRVALKLLRRGIDTEDVLSRFRAERQILATLNHPNIARLIGGGATSDGRPYLVMELVEGEPITAFADSRRLTVDQRLQLFVTVARAIQYAHRNLIVHRDIKPGNIMVANDGEVKLLDFGIAKLLDESTADAPHTQTGSRLFTPEYASPEQLRGETVTTASDVYQLGVLLYRLICGRLPTDFSAGRSRGAAPPTLREPAPPSVALERATADTDPDSSADSSEIARSRGTDPRRLRSRLRGELDVIACAALRIEPERRYATAAELADDVERHLQGRPITAHADTWRYRTQKFVRRHPGAVAAGIALVIAATGYIATLQAYADRLASERNIAQVEHLRAESAQQIAEAERARAEMERDRAEGSLTRAEAEQRRAAAAQMIAEAERARAQTEWGRAEGALSRELEQTARAQRVSGFLVGLFEALDPAESGLAEPSARDLLSRGIIEAEALEDDPLTQTELFEVLTGVHESLGFYPEALNLALRSLETRRFLFGNEHESVAESLTRLGEVRRRTGDLAGAEAAHREALALQHRLLGTEHASVATTLNSLGEVRRQKGDFAGAVALHREALEMRRALLDPEHPDVATSLSDLGEALRRQRDFRGAVVHHENALAIRRKAFGNEHPDVAASLNYLGLATTDAGDFDTAEVFHRQALEIWRRLLGDEHPSVAHGLNALGIVLQRKRDLEGAAATHEQALEIRRKLLGPEHTSVAQSLYNLGIIRRHQGRFDESVRDLRETLAIWEAAHGEEHPSVAAAHYNLGLALQHQEQLEASQHHLARSLSLRRELLGEENDEVAVSLSSLGSVLQQAGKLDEAEARFREALSLRHEFLGDAHPSVARSRNLLRNLLLEKGDFVGARACDDSRAVC